jgi:hypothetical protein
MLRRSANKFSQGNNNNPKRLVARGLFFGRKKEFDCDQVRTAGELQKRLRIGNWVPSIIEPLSWRVLEGKDPLPSSVRYSFLPRSLSYLLSAGAFGAAGGFGYASYTLWLREKEPHVAGRLACELTEENRQKLAAEAADPSLCLLSSTDIESLKDDIREGPVMAFIIGPKCIGKSVTLARIPETLGMKKAIYIRYNFKAGESLTTQLFNKFHSLAVGKGYPARPDGETPDDYLAKVFKHLGGKDAVLLLDLNRPDDKDWARKFTDQVRQVWTLGINIIVTSSEGQDIAESKEEPRRRIFLFPELPMEVAKKYVKQRFTNLNVTDKELEEALDSIPRNFVEIQGVLDWRGVHDTIAERNLWHRENVKAAFADAQCSTWRLFGQPDYPALNDLKAGKLITRERIRSTCAAPDAVQILLNQNIIRPYIKRSQESFKDGKKPNRAAFTYQHDCLRNAFLNHQTTLSVGPAESSHSVLPRL